MERLYKRGRLMYILEAGLEYLISILVADMYLASLTKELGISDDHSGLMELSGDTKIGTDIKEIFPIDDIIFEVDIPAICPTL